MTEKKSLEYLNKLHSKIVRSPFAKNVTEQEMLALIEGKKTLEEVQQYRALGTIEQLKTLQDDYWKLNEMCKEYSALGTVEELRVARDKQVAKKVNLRHIKKYDGFDDGECPTCGNSVLRDGFSNDVYCDECGQKLDLSDEDDKED